MEDYSNCWFIPKRLEIKGKPHLSVFPFNVVIMRQKADEVGNLIIVSVIYEPDFETYQDSGTVQSMRYPNMYGSECHLLLSYNKVRKSYGCEKYLNGKCVGMAAGGNDWNRYFAHAGIMGIAEGEPCNLEPVQPVDRNASATTKDGLQKPLSSEKLSTSTDPYEDFGIDVTEKFLDAAAQIINQPKSTHPLEYFKEASVNELIETGEHEPILFCQGSKGRSMFTLNKLPANFEERVRAVEWQGYTYAQDPQARESDGNPEYIFFVGITWDSLIPKENVKDGIITLMSQGDPRRKEVLAIYGRNMAIDFDLLLNREIIRNAEGEIVMLKDLQVPEDYLLLKNPFLEAFIAGYKEGRIAITN